MIKGGVGGGNTITGLIYEGKVDLATYLSQQKNYEVKGSDYFDYIPLQKLGLPVPEQ